MLTAAEQTDVRRFAGYQLVGTTMPITEDQDLVYSWYGMVAMSLYKRLASLSVSEEVVLRTKYLQVINSLEDAVVSAGADLDTDVAAVWTHNKSEVQDRTRLYNQKRRDMCEFLGLRPGPQLGAAGLTLIRS